MKKIIMLLCVLLTVLSCQSKSISDDLSPDNSTVQKLDIQRFMGIWYEIARYEHRFEKGMTHVSATYQLSDDGKISVVNAGLKEGKRKQIKGRAKQPDANDPGKLKVAFFLWFYSDYYILDIDPEYRYALIGSSSSKYLWIMSRTPTIPENDFELLIGKLKKRGYDTDRLIIVRQD